jgi:nucleotide-binding universal stress UspA family protein
MEVTMKNILLLVHDDEGQEARVQTALDLTRILGGHLTCVDVSIMPAAVGDVYSGAGVAMLLADERERESHNKSTLEKRLAAEGVSWDWVDVVGNLASCVIDTAEMADLIVLNRKLDEFSFPDMRDVSSRILMKTRKPIVAVPEAQKRFEAGRALIAWDGKSSVSATMRACTPLLALADDVLILMVRDGSEQTEPTEAAEYLSRHGIHASIRIIENGVEPADKLIMEECGAWRADYVLMGAYGHGRLMEAFGGVTKRMLSKSKVPLILGH